MTIYHGSDKIIYSPSYGGGNSANDFGRGFYCTESIELAREWACKNGENGFANKYTIDTRGLSVFRLNEEPYHILNWLALLTCYRGYWQKKSIAEDAKGFLQEHYLIDISSYDIIIGYRADDSYFSFAQDFIMGTISLQKLSEAMNLGHLGEQVVIKSEKAFGRIKYISYEEAFADIYYKKKCDMDLNARTAYSDMRSSADRLNEIYILDIMRGRVSEDELRI